MPTTRLASSPFNKPDADIILRSADGVDFCVRRHILFEASPIFESILSIPQPSTDLRPIVDLVEDQKTLDTILRICYPIVKAKSTLQLEEVERAVKAAQKYEMELPLAVLTDELLELAKASPLEVWAVGCRTGLERVARRAAAMLELGKPLKVEVGHLEGVSAGHYFRLLDFHRKKGNVDESFHFLASDEASAEEPAPTPDVSLSLDMPRPDLACISSDGVEFFAHIGCIASASTILREQIDQVSDFDAAGHLVLRFSERSGLLAVLLKLCYPNRNSFDLPSNPSALVDIFFALAKYRMETIRAIVLQKWETVAEAAPVQAYFAAARTRQRDCAEVAAKCSLSGTLEGRYVVDMEFSPAAAYHHLLAYHVSCNAVAKQLLRDVIPTTSSEKQPDKKLDTSGDLYEMVVAQMNDWLAKERLTKARMAKERLTKARMASDWEPDYKCALAPIPPLRTSQDAWLKSYIETLIARVDTRSTLVPLSPTALDAATAKGDLWCGTCCDFVKKLSAADAAVRSIRGRVAQASLFYPLSP